jgi:hypothetical protein
MDAPSEPVAGVGVADRQREEGEAEGYQYDVEHGCSLSKASERIF